ncbi:MAG: flavin reductase family protein [Chloroflexi bacterium]|nr:flavin reductase family protein [Chloroflexota bacterium]
MVKVAVKPGTYLYPVPAVMVTCGPPDKPNIITLAWVGTVCSEPPMVGISIRPSRYSHGLVKDQGEFALNLPTTDLVRELDYCGSVSGRKVDKFAATGLTPVPAKVIETVIIAECPVNIECKMEQILPLGTHDLFLGKIVAVQVNEDILDDKGDLDLTKAKPLIYGSHRYWSLGQLLATHGYSVKS